MAKKKIEKSNPAEKAMAATAGERMRELEKTADKALNIILDELYHTISNRFRSNEFIMAYEDCMRDCECIVLQEINKLKGKSNG